MSIVAPETPFGELLQTISVQAMSPTVIFDGEKPDRTSAVFDMCARSQRLAYVYVFMRDDRAIYVGKSVNPGARFGKHCHRDWFDVANRYVLLQVVGSDRCEADNMAFFVEKRAIRRLSPSHNIAGVA